MYTFKLVQITEEAIAETASFLSEVFISTSKFTEDFIKWEYVDNPIGSIVGFNAYEGDVLVGHYVTQPVIASVNGKLSKGLLSLNTATHHYHQGKGLFTKLAKLTFEYAAENGYEFVYGVANANSTPGFIKKLGFQFVAPLIVKVGIGILIKKNDNCNYDFERVWTKNDIKWRLINPEQPYFLRGNNIMVPTGKFGLNAILGNFENELLNNFKVRNLHKKLNVANLYVGIDNTIDWKKSFYFDVPSKFKSSPLNLIFKDLRSENYQLNKECVKFQIIDFDGY